MTACLVFSVTLGLVHTITCNVKLRTTQSAKGLSLPFSVSEARVTIAGRSVDVS